jgi:hypothetical protein
VLRGEAQPRGDAARPDAEAVAVHGDVEAADGRRVIGVEGAVDGVEARGPWMVVAGAEAEVGQVGPNAAPAAGEDAGARGGTGGPEAEEDAAQEVVGEAADTVVVIARAMAAVAVLAGHMADATGWSDGLDRRNRLVGFCVMQREDRRILLDGCVAIVQISISISAAKNRL